MAKQLALPLPSADPGKAAAGRAASAEGGRNTTKRQERNRQVVRQWEVLRELENGPRTLEELARTVGDCGVTPRTVRRDLEALEAARFPIFKEVHEDSRVRWHLLTKGVTPSRAA